MSSSSRISVRSTRRVAVLAAAVAAAAACEMYGYPGVSFAAASSAAGRQLTVLPVRAGQGLAGVTP